MPNTLSIGSNKHKQFNHPFLGFGTQGDQNNTTGRIAKMSPESGKACFLDVTM